MLRKILPLIASMFVFVSLASAQTTYRVPANSDVVQLTSADDADILQVAVETGRCYCCSITSTDNNDEAAFKGTSLVDDDQGGNTGAASSAIAAGSLEPRLYSGDSRICFRSFAAGNVTIPLQLSQSNATVSLSCEDTTLFSNFNTSVTDYNFAEIQNTQRRNSVTVVINATDSVSSSSVFSDEERTISASDRLDLDIHTSAGSGAFGPISICPIAPSGSVKSAVVQYRIDSQDSVQFTPVLREPFSGR